MPDFINASMSSAFPKIHLPPLVESSGSISVISGTSAFHSRILIVLKHVIGKNLAIVAALEFIYSQKESNRESLPVHRVISFESDQNVASSRYHLIRNLSNVLSLNDYA